MQQRPLRVLLTVVLHYADGAGGSSRLAFDEAIHLRDQGHEVWMLASSIKEGAPEYEFQNGIHFLRYHHQQKNALNPRRMFWYKDAIAGVLKRHGPEHFDVVHGHAALQHMAVCSRYRTSRKCFSIHSPILDEVAAHVRGMGIAAFTRQFLAHPMLRSIERDCLRTADWVNAFSNFTIKLMRQHHGALADSVQVVPGWTDLNRFHIVGERNAAKLQLGWRTDVPVLFTLRRLVTRMGLDRLITATSIMKKNGIDLQVVIGGSGPLRDSLEGLATTLGVSQEVKFVGFVPDEVLPLMYGACDAFVLPTAELECFGIIAIEAMACGRPVLATPIAAIPEIINRVEPRWLSESAAPEHIAELLTKFVLNKLPMHESAGLRGLVEKHWDGGRLLDVFCGAVLGTHRCEPTSADSSMQMSHQGAQN